ncbi:MAG: hypothetical protein FWH41_10360, partial [Treponema sp.]|nr:hypothetical protein [Treponema sp.]
MEKAVEGVFMFKKNIFWIIAISAIISLALAGCKDRKSPIAADEPQKASETETVQIIETMQAIEAIQVIESMQAIEFNDITDAPDYVDKIEVIGWSRNGLLAYRYASESGRGREQHFVILNAVTDEIIEE